MKSAGKDRTENCFFVSGKNTGAKKLRDNAFLFTRRVFRFGPAYRNTGNNLLARKPGPDKSAEKNCSEGVFALFRAGMEKRLRMARVYDIMI